MHLGQCEVFHSAYAPFSSKGHIPSFLRCGPHSYSHQIFWLSYSGVTKKKKKKKHLMSVNKNLVSRVARHRESG